MAEEDHAEHVEQDHESIVFSLEEQERQKSLLEEERERRRARAARFGTVYVDPAKQPEFQQQARRERFRREGFATGIDVFSEEERAKRAARAIKFGLPAEQAAAPGLAYAPDPEDVKRAARAKKFGIAFTGATPDTLLQKADLFEPRKDAPEDVPRREVAIYLYGVDLMSTQDVLSYFEDYGPSLVEWINDSSCCVVFEDAASTQRAIAGSGHPLAPGELTSAPDSMDVGLEPGQMSFLWHKGRDFVKGRDGRGKDLVVRLMYRMATDLDQRDPHADKRSRFLWQGKRRFDDYKQQQQQQQDRHRRGSRHGQDGWQDYEGGHDAAAAAGGDGAGEGCDGDEEMRAARRRRRGGRGRQWQQGDEEMADAEEGDAAAAAGDGNAAAAGAGDGGPDLRLMLKQRDAERRATEEELPYQEVPQPESGDEEELADAGDT